MDRAQFFKNFWSRFEWKAYDESTVPEKDSLNNDELKAKLPYITFMTIVDEFDHPVYPEASLWSYGTSWQEISQKAQEISEYIGYGGRTEKIDGGWVWIQRGHPFAQRLGDENDMIRRIVINIDVEFFAA